MLKSSNIEKIHIEDLERICLDIKNSSDGVINNINTALVSLKLFAHVMEILSHPGRFLRFKSIAAYTITSASSNVVPLTSASAGTAILTASAGKWCVLQSDGTNWQIVAGN